MLSLVCDLADSSTGTTAFSSPRLLLRLEENASLEVVEEFVGSEQQAKYFTNAVAEVHLDEGAQLNHG